MSEDFRAFLSYNARLIGLRVQYFFWDISQDALLFLGRAALRINEDAAAVIVKNAERWHETGECLAKRYLALLKEYEARVRKL